MKQMAFENIDLRKSDNLVITEDNLMSIGQKITYCSFRCVERYHYINLSYYSKGMYKSVMHFYEPNETLSDGYEIMQEYMLYLCKYLGRKLGDICKYDRHGDEVIDNMYPQIVDTELFEKVRKLIDKNKYGKRSVTVNYLLRHKIKCGYCGQSISAESGTAKNGQVKHYHKCLGRKHNNGCKKSTVRKDF